ncbi:ABC transporter permease [Streptomyces roseirectus]|uniref:ABC transporter permease n=1 Tax=Streptomyces roseirectus TaxID=2768066 RepID=A0A7H0IMJ0_9ACTN|nr:ABC transporter permease [Streptomyces roseirectus]QNP74006.1 ABC transporter permease [Streptomyces roseirectus]
MYVSALHAEWLKIRTLRSLVVTLAVILLATVGFSALAGLDAGVEDPLFTTYFGVSFGQIAAVSFAATATAAEFRDGALRVSLAAVPDRTRWFAAKVTAIGLPVLAVGLLTGVAVLPLGSGLTWAEGVRGAVGCALYLTLMALLAAGLTAVLRSGVATLGILVPFLLLVSFVIGDMSGTVADWLPDRAGQAALHSDPAVNPWLGLLVTGLWSAAALGAGAWRVRKRDA